MSTKVYALIVTLSLTMVLTGAAAPARASQAIVAAIPFDFVVGRETLPAGKYRIRQASDVNARVLILENPERSIRAVVETTAGGLTDPEAVETLVFDRHGDTYFLTTVSLRGIASCNLRRSPAAQELASSGTKLVKVTLKLGS